MQVAEHGPIRIYQFGTLDNSRLSHGVFARHGGVSPAPYASLNLSVSTGDSHENVRENRLRAFQALDRAPDSVADLWQVHSAGVIVAHAPNGSRGYLGQADSLIADRPEVTLFLRYADCVPILLFDPRRPAVGLVHAGWRGTLLKAPAAAVRAMTQHFQSRPSDIQAAIGPSIGPCHYAIGPEVVSQVRQTFPQRDELLPSVNGGHHLDLWTANALALREVGVEHIEQGNVCTACREDDFFSHRAAQGRTGRFGALIGLS